MNKQKTPQAHDIISMVCLALMLQARRWWRHMRSPRELQRKHRMADQSPSEFW
jgi:hypothetical protein